MKRYSDNAYAFVRVCATLSGVEPFKTGYDAPEIATANEAQIVWVAGGSVGTLNAPSGDDTIGQTYELTCLTRTMYLTDRVFFIGLQSRIAKSSLGVINDTSSNYSYQNAPSLMYSQPSAEQYTLLPAMEIQSYIETCAFQSVGASAASGANFYNTYPGNPRYQDHKPLLFGWLESAEKMYYVNTSTASLSVPSGYGSSNSFVQINGYSIIFVTKEVRDQFKTVWDKLGYTQGEVWSLDEVQAVLDNQSGCACRNNVLSQVFPAINTKMISMSDKFNLIAAIAASGKIGASSHYPDLVRIHPQVGKVAFTSTTLAAVSSSEPYGGISAPAYLTQPVLYAQGSMTSRYRYVATHYGVALSSTTYLCVALSAWYGGVPGSEASRSPFDINADGRGWNPERVGSTIAATGDSSVVMRQITLGSLKRMRQTLLFGGNKQREGIYLSNGFSSAQTFEGTILFYGYLLEFTTSTIAADFDKHMAAIAAMSRLAAKPPEVVINKLTV